MSITKTDTIIKQADKSVLKLQRMPTMLPRKTMNKTASSNIFATSGREKKVTESYSAS
jgi:hypothetical protein